MYEPTTTPASEMKKILVHFKTKKTVVSPRDVESQILFWKNSKAR